MSWYTYTLWNESVGRPARHAEGEHFAWVWSGLCILLPLMVPALLMQDVCTWKYLDREQYPIYITQFLLGRAL